MELETKLNEIQEGVEAKAVAKAEALVKEVEEKISKSQDEIISKVEKAMSAKEAAEKAEKKGYDAKAAGEFMMKMLEANPEQGQVMYKANDVTVGDDTSLGYLAGHLMANDVAERRYLTSPMRSIATVMNIAQAESISLPYETDRTRAVWASELQNGGNGQKPTIAQVKLTPHRLTTKVGITSEMMRAGRVLIEQYVRQTVSRDFNLTENTAFISGQGMERSQPLGILNSGITKNVNSATAGEISFEDLFDLVAEIPQYDKVFVMNSKTIAELRKQKGNDQFLWTAPAENNPGTIAGIRYMTFEDMPDVATGATPVIIGDFSQYYIVENGGMEVIVDRYSRKEEGITELQFVKFVDGRVRQLDAFAQLTIS